jgi:tRNA(Arg) A34 adenosine deaminase TadA
MDRRSLLTGGGTILVAATLARGAEARAKLSPATPEDARFMQVAIEQAKGADYPFGAVIVRGDSVLALGRNSTKRLHDPTAHAEMEAIRAFLKGHEPDDFTTTTIYASGEPCPMCMGAIIWCGFKRLVYAASISELSKEIGQINITAARIAKAAPFADIEITPGVMSRESMALFAGKDGDK